MKIRALFTQPIRPPQIDSRIQGKIWGNTNLLANWNFVHMKCYSYLTTNAAMLLVLFNSHYTNNLLESKTCRPWSALGKGNQYHLCNCPTTMLPQKHCPGLQLLLLHRFGQRQSVRFRHLPTTMSCCPLPISQRCAGGESGISLGVEMAKSVN